MTSGFSAMTGVSGTNYFTGDDSLKAGVSRASGMNLVGLFWSRSIFSSSFLSSITGSAFGISGDAVTCSVFGGSMVSSSFGGEFVEGGGCDSSTNWTSVSNFFLFFLAFSLASWIALFCFGSFFSSTGSGVRSSMVFSSELWTPRTLSGKWALESLSKISTSFWPCLLLCFPKKAEFFASANADFGVFLGFFLGLAAFFFSLASWAS